MKNETKNNMVETQKRDGSIVMILKNNELDLRKTPGLTGIVHDVIDSQNENLVIIDLGLVEYVDSIGVSFLAMLRRKVHTCGKKLAVVCAKKSILEVFAILHVAAYFNVYPSVDAVYKSETPASCA